MSVKIITPYINDEEIKQHKDLFWEHDIYYEKDVAGIGSDLMFQKMWNKFPDDDIFILHADMFEIEEGWFDKVLDYVDKYPEAGIFGCLLLYPMTDSDGVHYVQSAGGKFTKNGDPDHFGSGISVQGKTTFKEELELDFGQFDKVREVAWTTFGGCYIRRSVIKDIGGFSPEFEWTYNRDVDFCLESRSAGYKIYQIPVRLLHYESRDNSRVKSVDNNKLYMELRNRERLKSKWSNTEFYKSLDKVIKIE